MKEQRTKMAHLRTFLIVSLITAMVWLLAESRMVRTRTVEASLVLAVLNSGGESNLVVRQVESERSTRTISITVEGSLAGIDRFTRALQNQVELRVGRDIPAQSGVHTLELRELLDGAPDLEIHGLVIQEVTPKEIVVQVDELITRQFKVHVALPDDVELDSVPRAEPASVRVTAPMSVLSEIGELDSIVGIDESMVAQLTQGRLETIPGLVVEVPGIDPAGWETIIEPSQVDALVTLRTRTSSLTIPRLPVQVLMAPNGVGRWVVQIEDGDQDLVNVQIEGPAEGIELLQSGEVQARAVVELSFEDLGRQIRSKAAKIIGLPDGCRVVSSEVVIDLVIQPNEVVNESDTPGSGAEPGG